MKKLLALTAIMLTAFAPVANAGPRVTSRNILVAYWDSNYKGTHRTLTADPDYGDCSSSVTYIMSLDSGRFIWNNVGLNVNSFAKTPQAPGCNYIVMYYHVPSFFAVRPYEIGICGAGALPMADIGRCKNNVGTVLIEHHNT